MNPPFPNCIRVTKTVPVSIPTVEGDAVAETIPVEIEVWRNLTTGEDYLDGQARTKLEAAKARHMGLLTLDGIPHTTSP